MWKKMDLKIKIKPIQRKKKKRKRESEREKNDSAKFHNSAMPEDSYGYGLLFFS